MIVLLYIFTLPSPRVFTSALAVQYPCFPQKLRVYHVSTSVQYHKYRKVLVSRLRRYSVVERKVICISCLGRLLELAHFLCPSEATCIA